MPASDQKVSKDRYTLVPRTLIFLVEEQRVLLIQGTPHKNLWAGKYNGVGGHIERGEDPLNAARRELYEETGLTAADLRLVGVIAIDTGKNIGIGIYVFRGDHPSGVLTASPEGKLEWVPLGALNDLPLVEDLPILLPKVLDKDPGARPFSGLYTYDEQGNLLIRLAEQSTVR